MPSLVGSEMCIRDRGLVSTLCTDWQPKYHTCVRHRFVCKRTDRVFTIIQTPKTFRIPDMVGLCSNSFMGVYIFCAMPVPLCSLGETRFQPLQGSITGALRRCDSINVGWLSLGVWPRPRLASFARHKFFFLWPEGPYPFLFLFLPRLALQRCPAQFLRISI